MKKFFTKEIVKGNIMKQSTVNSKKNRLKILYLAHQLVKIKHKNERTGKDAVKQVITANIINENIQWKLTCQSLSPGLINLTSITLLDKTPEYRNGFT